MVFACIVLYHLYSFFFKQKKEKEKYIEVEGLVDYWDAIKKNDAANMLGRALYYQ